MFILALLLVGGAIGFFIAAHGEPAFEGKRLSSWLRDLRDPSALVQHRAQNALRHMGTNAVLLPRADSARLEQKLSAVLNSSRSGTAGLAGGPKIAHANAALIRRSRAGAMLILKRV